MADDSMDPVKIGLIAQVEELSSFPEVPAAAEAMRDYFNAELGGIDGHPVELVTCTAGDTPESAVACAQEFANDDSVHVVLQGHLNTVATNDTFVAAGKPVLNLGNDIPDYLVPGVFTFDPGVLGLANVIFVYAGGTLGATTATIFYADDPLFEGFLPLLDALAAAEGITVTENIPLGFEPDLTGAVAAADSSNEAWIFVLADGAQCTAAASAVDTVGYEGAVIANDLCMAAEVVESGAVDGWSGPVVSLAPTNDPDPDVAEINRILDTYGGDNAQTAGLAGWTIANMEIARDVLAAGGAAAATDAAVTEALSSYARADLLGYPEVSCPGPGSFVGACDRSPLVVVVDGGQMTAPDGFVEIDYSQFEVLLEG
jgi:branched-chain amino acid transport system substrate-binding protein